MASPGSSSRPGGSTRPGPAGSLLVAGTSSDAGKSLVSTGICRWLHRRGVSVAPFKAMTMSNNSVVTADGGEIGRAQGSQATACGLEPETAMNPVLVKPGGESRSHVVLRGRPLTEAAATDYRALHRSCRRPPWRPSTSSPPGSTWWCARGPAARPRSTCGPPTWPISGWPGRAASRWSWWPTSTAAACSPACSARWRCGRRRTRPWSPGSW